MIEKLQRYRPALPMPQLVAEINKLHHEREAAIYERTHPEIFEQLPPLWREMIGVCQQFLGDREGRLRILDFGCGTGFEARQCVGGLGAARIGRLVCYDPSPHMIERCRRSLEGRGVQAEYATDPAALDGEFDLLITNSVLHHIVDPLAAISGLMPLLAPGAVWLSGHEPSRRYLANPECRAVLTRYDARHRWWRMLEARRYARRALRFARLAELPEDFAARRAFEGALFGRRPPARLVSRLVDFHVVQDDSEAGAARGLDFAALEAAWRGEWELVWRRTYAFLGPHYTDTVPARWRGEANRLAKKHPDDGANCCLVWRRTALGNRS
jgi:SAM-dependent methyltransferase